MDTKQRHSEKRVALTMSAEELAALDDYRAAHLPKSGFIPDRAVVIRRSIAELIHRDGAESVGAPVLSVPVRAPEPPDAKIPTKAEQRQALWKGGGR